MTDINIKEKTDDIIKFNEETRKKITESAKTVTNNLLEELSDLELRYKRKQLKRVYYRKQKKYLIKEFSFDIRLINKDLDIVEDKEFLLDFLKEDVNMADYDVGLGDYLE